MKKNILISFQISFLVSLLSCKKDNGNTTPVLPTPIAVEMLQNGNLEGATQNWFPYFEPQRTVNPNSYIMELSEDFAASPKKSLKIKCDKVNETGAFCQYNQVFSTTGLKTGQVLTLTAKIKGVNLTGQGVSMAIRGDKTGQPNVFFKTSQGTTPITSNFDFKEFSVSIPSYAGNADDIVVFLVFLPNTTGTVYMDDISLKAL